MSKKTTMLTTQGGRPAQEKHGSAATKGKPRAGGAFAEDKRKEVRQEHTNHFTSREGYPKKK
jgi:hypothetical protein